MKNVCTKCVLSSSYEVLQLHGCSVIYTQLQRFINNQLFTSSLWMSQLKINSELLFCVSLLLLILCTYRRYECIWIHRDRAQSGEYNQSSMHLAVTLHRFTKMEQPRLNTRHRPFMTVRTEIQILKFLVQRYPESFYCISYSTISS